jgi:hypothetical protein
MSLNETCPQTFIPLFLLDTAFLRNTRQPVEKDRCRHVEDDERPQDPKVPPPERVGRVYIAKERVCRRHFAELTVGRCIRIDQGAASCCYVALQVLAACLTTRRFEMSDLDT